LSFLLRTEQPHPDQVGLDGYDTPALVGALLADQALAAAAVLAAAPQLAQAVDAAVPRLRAGGRIVYVGAGTSGRLGVLDSVELHSTFSWPRERSPALLAGGESAMFVAVEGAEDDRAQGATDLRGLAPTAHDVVLLLAASGGAPYALCAAEAARAAGALTVGIVNNPGAPLAAATDKKMALNTFSSSVLVRLNKVYSNLMVDVRATNAKLVRRALALTVRASGAGEERAREALAECGSSVKVAVVMLRAGIGAAEAARRLEAAEGSVHLALQ